MRVELYHQSIRFKKELAYKKSIELQDKMLGHSGNKYL